LSATAFQFVRSPGCFSGALRVMRVRVTGPVEKNVKGVAVGPAYRKAIQALVPGCLGEVEGSDSYHSVEDACAQNLIDRALE
jgi:hypothetical protein